ncbi:hypothetical protein KPNIH5_09976 [Klebsiella pneumoniae subsp. pneumoniae KPNIH5]|nr:hypothetical protein KPNIH4_11185 [Klebsiella pneumoniae subsp. pneumoniae KPNIH4]EJJ57532.1 hypothetical protein KPNIH5_09976 [Klebsiella pneumoniae subsp. pneumoniae KPNIH5]
MPAAVAPPVCGLFAQQPLQARLAPVFNPFAEHEQA